MGRRRGDSRCVTNRFTSARTRSTDPELHRAANCRTRAAQVPDALKARPRTSCKSGGAKLRGRSELSVFPNVEFIVNIIVDIYVAKT